MTELQEIKLGYSAAANPRSTVSVDTNCGKVSVTVVGERTNNKLFPLITLHDFGFDHESQFRALERSGEDADKFFSQFVTYHIDMPGSEEGAGDVSGQYASLDDLASIVAHVRSALSITDPMVLLGVGAGANVAMRYMLKHARTVLGVILVEVTNDSETWTKWTQDKITDLITKPSEVVSARTRTPAELASSLLDKHFGRSTSPTHILTDCRQYLTQRLLTSQNIKNINLYQQSFYQRKPVLLSDFNGDTVVPALVIAGKQSWRNDASVEVRSQLQQSGKEVTLLEPSPCYLLPLEEAGKKCAISMMLFIQSLGIGLSAGLTSATSLQDAYKRVENIAEMKDPVLV